jgi:hypothetical protein
MCFPPYTSNPSAIEGPSIFLCPKSWNLSAMTLSRLSIGPVQEWISERRSPQTKAQRSIFEWIQERPATSAAAVVFCDDGSGEMADFIAIENTDAGSGPPRAALLFSYRNCCTACCTACVHESLACNCWQSCGKFFTLSVGGLLPYAEQIARMYSQLRWSLSTAMVEPDAVASAGFFVVCTSDCICCAVILRTGAVAGIGMQYRQPSRLGGRNFRLLQSGARTVTGSHHSPKGFENQTYMSLENMPRGSGDIGAILSTAWGVRMLDQSKTLVHVENIKPRDFEPPPPFQIQGRPQINDGRGFQMVRKPDECGSLSDYAKKPCGRPRSAEKETRTMLIADALRESKTQEEIAEMLKTAGVMVPKPSVLKKEMSIARRAGKAKF